MSFVTKYISIFPRDRLLSYETEWWLGFEETSRKSRTSELPFVRKQKSVGWKVWKFWDDVRQTKRTLCSRATRNCFRGFRFRGKPADCFRESDKFGDTRWYKLWTNERVYRGFTFRRDIRGGCIRYLQIFSCESATAMKLHKFEWKVLIGTCWVFFSDASLR